MDEAKKSALETAGWQSGTVAEFLGLTEEEILEVERRVAALRSRSASELRRVATMVEGKRHENGGETTP